ncbi:MAG: DUF151 domain-containing protein [Bacteroidales bacterium]|jgi:bifunctional DNase/RNase|nr:DUF151 domain-containing protein [Bacteroidales bacterium]
MKRIRLDIGALTAFSTEKGKYIFFLYAKGSDKCLYVPLTPPDVHNLLANFKGVEGQTFPFHSLISTVLKCYYVSLEEVSITYRQDDGKFYSRLHFLGDRDIYKDADFIDGIILSKLFSCPIYISEKLFNSHAVKAELSLKGEISSTVYRAGLEKSLNSAMTEERYEEAETIYSELKKLEKEEKKLNKRKKNK